MLTRYLVLVGPKVPVGIPTGTWAEDALNFKIPSKALGESTLSIPGVVPVYPGTGRYLLSTTEHIEYAIQGR